MNIKSLLLGSAAALVAVSGARAADAVVIPEPEAVEYVRVCDAAGAGYFYIPGGETCLKISGYVRYEMNFAKKDDDAARGVDARGTNDGAGDWGKKSEVRLNVEAWNDTELGPLYSRIRLGYDSTPSQDGDNDDSGLSIDHAVIQLAGLTIGKNASWWDWGFGADGDGIVNFGPGEVGMVAYTANAGGFGITLALEEDEDGDYVPDVLLDVNGSIGEIGLHAGLAYNESEEALTAKIYASYNFGAATLGLGYQYSDDSKLGTEYLAAFEHVLGADISADLTEKLAARAGFNYGLDNTAGLDGYTVGAGVNYKVVSGFDIDARVNYSGGDALEDANGDGVWGGRVRFTRSF
ncbi:porin [Ahrensia sp. 13_GOM-1096m]|uniref:porin n=1 Tax=Ahrensia sp. 13_GOM-1096m TaxID=1380380 RepID=UPI00047CDE80|nr:porin [Ahrensia sp. 13_GOM-1096m]